MELYVKNGGIFQLSDVCENSDDGMSSNDGDFIKSKNNNEVVAK